MGLPGRVGLSPASATPQRRRPRTTEWAPRLRDLRPGKRPDKMPSRGDLRSARSFQGWGGVAARAVKTTTPTSAASSQNATGSPATVTSTADTRCSVCPEVEPGGRSPAPVGLNVGLTRSSCPGRIGLFARAALFFRPFLAGAAAQLRGRRFQSKRRNPEGQAQRQSHASEEAATGQETSLTSAHAR